MIAIFYLVLQILKIYTYVVIANVVISWLVAFNVLNTSNRFVYSILEFTYRLTEPFLNRIRRFLPNFGHFWNKIAHNRLIFGPGTLKVVIHVSLEPKDDVKNVALSNW